MSSRAVTRLLQAPSSQEICRSFWERKDVSLGLVPQLLLEESQAALWADLWFAARYVDEAIEQRQARGSDFARRLRQRTSAHPAEAALARFLERLPPAWNRSHVEDELEQALESLDRERDFAGPPPWSEYAAVVRQKAGIPLLLLNRLLLPSEDLEAIHRFSLPLAFSIQVGDDARDRARDAALGLHTIAEEELEWAAQRFPHEPDPVGAVIVPWREAFCKLLALYALKEAHHFQQPPHRARARLEALLWLQAVESGQLREHQFEVRWPQPLQELLTNGPPTPARMAAARSLLHEEAVWATGTRWRAPQIAQEIRRLKRNLPPLYVALGRDALLFGYVSAAAGI